MPDEPAQTRTPKARRKLRWEKAFLNALADSGNVRQASAAAGVGRRTCYDHRKAHPDFKAAWDDALQTAADLLELEAWRRAHDGVDEPVVYQGKLCGSWVDVQGRVVAEGTEGARLVPLTIKRYSDALLMFLLKAHRPKRFRERATVEHRGKDSGPIQTEAKLVIYIPDNGRNAPDQGPARPPSDAAV